MSTPCPGRSSCAPGPARHRRVVSGRGLRPLASSFGSSSRRREDPFVKLCQVDHPVFSFRVDPYLSNRGADRRHRLPVCSIEALLDSVDLVPCSPPGILRKRSHISSGRPHPDDRLQHPSRLYNILYNPVKPPNLALQLRRWASLATRHQPPSRTGEHDDRSS